jgi:hypothetical protein
MRNFDINFIVHTPYPENVNYIGGVMACHSLANDIAVLGENAYIHANNTNINYKCNVIPWESVLSCDKENTIVIYTAGADHVFPKESLEKIQSIPNRIRWLVGDQQYDYPKEDKFYKYCNHFIPYPNQKVDGEFLSYDVDYDLFSNKNLPRSGTSFFTKGNNIKNPKHPKDSINLDIIYSIPPKERNKYLSKIFNTTETFYVYTHRSFIAVLASLCGCNVVVFPYTWEGNEIPLDTFDINLWRESLPTFKYGISCGVDDLNWSIDTKHLTQERIKEIKTKGTLDIKSFINDCYIWLETKYNLK